MKDLLAKNFEKVLLTTLLVVLAACSVFLIITMDRTEIKVINNPNAGAMIPDEEIADIPQLSIRLTEDKLQPFDPRGYIYCRKSDCNYLILSSLPKCPWCKTDTRPEVEVVTGTGDKDDDGISDQDEIKLGLNPEDPKDAYLDSDSDGFMNIDEYKQDFDISDANSHPSVINRSKLHKRIRLTTYYPVKLSYLTIGNKDDKKTWDIFGDIINPRTGRKVKGLYKRVNDKIDEVGYTITDVGVEDGKEFIILEKADEDPVKLFAKEIKRKQVVYVIVNELLPDNEQITMVELGKEFKLKDKAGNEGKYKAESFDLSTKTLTVIDYQTSQKVKLGLDTILKETPQTSPELNPEFDDIPIELR